MRVGDTQTQTLNDFADTMLYELTMTDTPYDIAHDAFGGMHAPRNAGAQLTALLERDLLYGWHTVLRRRHES